MKSFLGSTIIILALTISSCDMYRPFDDTDSSTDTTVSFVNIDTLENVSIDSVDKKESFNSQVIDTSLFQLDRIAFVNYAKTLIGVTYKYASIDPAIGFDCSGFITYVFNHFNLSVPRSSIDFTNYGRTINKGKAQQGDLILFTGTNPDERAVGHMGIIVNNTDSLRFIHSTSGKANGVTITTLNEYYMKRFVKVIRVFR